MAVNVDRVSERELGDLAFTHPEVYAALKHIFDILRQERERSGGDEDSITRLSFVSEAEDSKRFVEIRNLTKKVGMIQLQLEQIQSDLNLLKHQIRDKPTEALFVNLDRIEKRLNHLELK